MAMNSTAIEKCLATLSCFGFFLMRSEDMRKLENFNGQSRIFLYIFSVYFIEGGGG